MATRRPVPRLRLGPIVGHTDHISSRVWIRAGDDPARYALRLPGHGVFPFRSTEQAFDLGAPLEFCTAIAVAHGLQSERRYRYQVLRLGRAVPGAHGSFRTLPPPGSFASLSFGVLSCSAQDELGLWPDLEDFLGDAPPHFLLMIGDQVYLDDGPADVWKRHLGSSPEVRRRAMAERYQESWSRPAVRRVLARVPSYVIWDDHEIRDGWGSLAGDSPTLAARYPRGREIFGRFNAYFEDARRVFWHFQACRNPPALTLPGEDAAAAGDPAAFLAAGSRRALPFALRCGRLGVVVVDSRGARDPWRAGRPSIPNGTPGGAPCTGDPPILGRDQWAFLHRLIAHLPADLDALAIATPVPIAAASPTGSPQHLIGGRNDDVAAFAAGNAKRLEAIRGEKGTDSTGETVGNLVAATVGAWLREETGVAAHLGAFLLSELDDVRDQWAHRLSRPEQEALIRAAVVARTVHRPPGQPRAVFFLGGDLHAGGRLDLEVARPRCTLPCLIASGISKRTGKSQILHALLDEDFTVAPGIDARLTALVNDFNFGLVQVMPAGATAVVQPLLYSRGTSWAWGIEEIHLGPFSTAG